MCTMKVPKIVLHYESPKDSYYIGSSFPRIDDDTNTRSKLSKLRFLFHCISHCKFMVYAEQNV